MADLIEIGINVNSNAEIAYRGLDKLNGSVVNSIKTAERLEKNYALLDKAIAKNKITLEQYAKGIQQTDAAIEAVINSTTRATAVTTSNTRATSSAAIAAQELADAQRMAGKDTNRFGMVAQQVGYQVGDFFVQVQSGTSALVAFGQQGTQLAGLLPGVAGAAIGIALSLGTALAGALLRLNTATEAVKALKEELSAAEEEAVRLGRGLATLAQSKAVDEIAKMESQIAALKETASQADPEAYGFIMLNVDAREKELAVLKETLQALIDRGHETYRLTEIDRARVALQQEAAQLRIEESQAYADTVEEANKLKDSIGQAYLEALGLAQVPVETGIDKAAEAARLLAERLGISLTQAQNLVNLAPKYLPMTMAPSDPTEWAKNELGFINPDRLLPPTSNVVSSGSSGGGGGSPARDPLADLMKRIELEKELLGTSEAYQEVIRATQNSDKQYSDAAIQGAVARIEAINQEKEALQQMQSLQQSVADTIGDGLMSMVDGTMSVKDAFRSMARDIIKQLYEVLVVQRLVGNAQGGTGIAGLLGGLFANGGAFSAGKQIQAYANGGVVGGPTYFPMAGGKTGLMGEAGPEAIMPLKRGKDGKLGVSVDGGSGSVNVVNNINVSGGSDPAAIRAEVAKLMPQITSATKSAVIDARRRGGQMKAAFS